MGLVLKGLKTTTNKVNDKGTKVSKVLQHKFGMINLLLLTIQTFTQTC